MSKKQPNSEAKLRTPKTPDTANAPDEPDLTSIDGSELQGVTGGWVRPILGIRPRTIRMPGSGDCTYA